MARQMNTLFLEQWLRTNVVGISHTVSGHPLSSARAIIQAWSELRDSLQNQTFHPHILRSLKPLVNSQASLHVADPQAKLLLSVLSSGSSDLCSESYPILLRLLYIWIRKSVRPSIALVDSAVDVLSRVFATEYGSKKNPSFLAEGILTLGAISFVPSVSESSKIACLALLCRLLEEDYKLVRLGEGIVPNVLAGIGYALSSTVDVHFVRVLDSLLGIWGKEYGVHSTVPTALMILHLVEWVVSGYIKSRALKKIEAFSQQTLGTSKPSYVPFALVMVAAGVLRATRHAANSQGLEFVSVLRISAENEIAFVAQELISRTKGSINLENDPANSLLQQCLSLALARSGAVSFTAPVLLCLASALLREIFPLRHLYMRILQFIHSGGSEFGINEIKKHLDSLLFKEAGVVTGVFCNQYASAEEQSKSLVESLIWDYCRDVYSGHRQDALLLRERNDELLVDLEKIAESAFLMVAVFALAVTKQRLNSSFSQETQREKSVQILVSFSCLEYFRRIRLPEYMDTIRRVVACVQENDSACISFVESMPTYVDLTTWQDFSSKQKMEYEWFKDEVLPVLMKSLAQLIIQLPKTGQIMVLNDLYAQVAESDDVTRKPALVSWLQSLSYLSSQAKMEVSTSKERESKENLASPGTIEANARL